MSISASVFVECWSSDNAMHLVNNTREVTVRLRWSPPVPLECNPGQTKPAFVKEPADQRDAVRNSPRRCHPGWELSCAS